MQKKPYTQTEIQKERDAGEGGTIERVRVRGEAGGMETQARGRDEDGKGERGGEGGRMERVRVRGEAGGRERPATEDGEGEGERGRTEREG